MAGISATSRSFATAIAPWACRREGGGATGGPGTPDASSVVSDMQVHSFHGGHHLAVGPVPGELGHDAPLEHHEYPVAAPQVVHLVRRDHHAGAPVSDVRDLAEQELL